MLTIEPEGGIGNRLHAMHSGIALARDIGQPVRLVWVKNRDLGCDLQQFLELPPEFRSVLTFSKLNWSKRTKIRYNYERYCRIDYLRPDYRGLEIEALMEMDFDFRQFAERKRTHIKCWRAFYNCDEPFYKFRPAVHLRSKIEAITSGFDNTVGVHIRRTDHLPSRDYSPTSMFIERMNALANSDPTVNFFVSSDNPEEEEDIRSRFGDRILPSPQRIIGRLTDEALESAVVDLFCLAATRKIIGSFKSSFSGSAARLGNIPFEEILCEDDPVVRW